MKRLLDVDQYGIKTYFETDRDTGRNIYHSVQDVEPIIEENKQILDPRKQKGNMKHVGQIPLLLCQQWATECGHKVFSKQWQEYAFKQFNSPEYRKLNPHNYKVRGKQ